MLFESRNIPEFARARSNVILIVVETLEWSTSTRFPFFAKNSFLIRLIRGQKQLEYLVN